MCQPIRGQGAYIGFRIGLKSNNTWLGPHKEHLWQFWSRSLQPFLRSSKYVSQSEARAAILDFGSTEKVTTLGWDLIRNICGKFGVDPFSRSWEEVENVKSWRTTDAAPWHKLTWPTCMLMWVKTMFKNKISLKYA